MAFLKVARTCIPNMILINAVYDLLQLSFEVGILTIFGHLKDNHRGELKKNYLIVDKGYNSFSTNIPGTPYKKALQVGKLSCYSISYPL